MKPGDIIQTFADPLRCKNPLGQVRLVRCLQERPVLDLWIVEPLDQEGHYYERFIKRIGDNGNGENKIVNQ